MCLGMVAAGYAAASARLKALGDAVAAAWAAMLNVQRRRRQRATRHRKQVVNVLVGGRLVARITEQDLSTSNAGF